MGRNASGYAVLANGGGQAAIELASVVGREAGDAVESRKQSHLDPGMRGQDAIARQNARGSPAAVGSPPPWSTAVERDVARPARWDGTRRGSRRSRTAAAKGRSKWRRWWVARPGRRPNRGSSRT